MVNKQIKLILATVVMTTIFSFGALPKTAKAYNAGGDGKVKFNSWDINNFNSSADLWTQTKSNYDPERIKDRVTYGDYDGNGKDEVIAFYDYENANTGIHRLYENGGKYSYTTIWESGVNNFNAGSITNKVVSGDFNGDGKDEVLTLYDYKNKTSKMFQFSLNGDGKITSYKTVWNTTDFVADMVNAMVAGDFNGDGKDEVLIFYDYGNNVNVVFELTMGSNGTFTSKNAFKTTSFAGSQIEGKTVAGDFNGDGKDEVAMFYDYGNNVTRIFSLSNNNGTYSLSETWYSSTFNGASINRKVVSTKNSSGKDEIIALYDYGKNVTGIFTWNLQSNGKFTAVKEKELTNYEAERVTGRVAVGKINGQTTRLLAMYDGTVVQSQTTGEKVVAEAKKYIGVPYVWDGESPAGFDCSGFTTYVYRQFGINIPSYTVSQLNYGTYVAYSNLKPGDLVFFDNTYNGPNPTHVGIYAGNGQMVHAGDNGVEVSYITTSYWQQRYSTARRLL